MVKYSLNTLKAISKFFIHYNDIDIYIEDKCTELYRELFKRLISKRIKIRKIFNIGTKSSVINECKNSSSNRNSIYIIDGDTELILGNKHNLPKLFVLDVYCIENYLIEENAIVEVLHSNSGELSRKEIKEKLKFKDWIDLFKKDLMELYFIFAISCKYSTGLKFASISDVSDKGELCIKKIDKVKGIFKTKIKKCVKNINFENELNFLKKKWPYLQENFLKIVSGKDFLIPLIIKEMNKVVKATYRKLPLKMSLVKEIKLNRLKKLKVAIEKCTT